MLAHAAPLGASPSTVRPHYLTTSSTPPAPPRPAPLAAVGYFAIVRAIRASARLTSTDRLVLLTIASHVDNRSGVAWPSIPTLAAECGLTTRTITLSGFTGVGTLAFSLLPGSATDLSSNPAPGAGPAATVGVATVAPVIATQPAPFANAAPGGSVTLTVAATSPNSGALTY